LSRFVWFATFWPGQWGAQGEVVVRFRIAEALWNGARPDREREWRQALADLNHEHDGAPPILTLDRRADGGASILIERTGGAVDEVPLACSLLRDSFRAYREVMLRLAQAGDGGLGSRDWESLDYAKKLVHDDAGVLIHKALGSHLRAGEVVDLTLARRLFTLLFLLVCDVAAELTARHRSHGAPT